MALDLISRLGTRITELEGTKMRSLKLRDYEYIRGILEQKIENWLDQERNGGSHHHQFGFSAYLDQLEIVVKHL